MMRYADHAAEVAALKQAYWEARAILGFDNDGDPTPAALTFPTIPDLMRRDAAEFRKDYDEACDALAAANARAEAAEAVCAEAYQVVGSLLSDVGAFDSEQGQKVLDNLSQHRMVHDDVLPWPSFDAQLAEAVGRGEGE